MNANFGTWFDGLERAHGGPIAVGVLRAQPEDFHVAEHLGFALAEDGDHSWLRLELTGLNTAYVAEQLAAANAVPLHAVGYSGLKDRHAVTQQWFSLPCANSAITLPPLPGLRLLAQGRHGKKLKRGTHKENAFRLRIRELEAGPDLLVDRLHRLGQQGFPNYFGPQRFGRRFANLTKASDWAANPRPLHRQQRGFVFSAARAALFNSILSARVAMQQWMSPIEGDLMNLSGSNSVFAVELLDATLQQRCLDGDIQPSGTLWGQGGSRLQGRAKTVEDEALAACWSDIALALEKTKGLSASTRPLRVIPTELKWQIEKDEMSLSFRLRRGSFATALTRELGVFVDA